MGGLVERGTAHTKPTCAQKNLQLTKISRESVFAAFLPLYAYSLCEALGGHSRPGGVIMSQMLT